VEFISDYLPVKLIFITIHVLLLFMVKILIQVIKKQDKTNHVMEIS